MKKMLCASVLLGTLLLSGCGQSDDEIIQHATTYEDCTKIKDQTKFKVCYRKVMIGDSYLKFFVRKPSTT
jgi:major membrane immunogen (membrane-anchored lipoprotein)